MIEEGPHGVAILRGSQLEDLDPAAVQSLFRERGAIWFRGLSIRAQDFFDFIAQYSAELITLNSYERIRHREIEEIQSVTNGTEPLNFHTEMGHAPGRPDFLSFWCETPSSSGGQTLLADGIRLFEALSEPTQRLFLEKRIQYVMIVPKEWWTDRLQSDRQEDIDRALAGIPDFTVHRGDEDSLVFEWRTYAAFRPNFSDRIALASNVFPYVVPGLTVTFEDGSPIPHEIGRELHEKAESIAAEIAWSPNEVVLFDNTRWLHGRREILGHRRRRVQMLQGYLSFAPEGRPTIKTRRA